jgi:hypothetical protein
MKLVLFKVLHITKVGDIEMNVILLSINATLREYYALRYRKNAN